MDAPQFTRDDMIKLAEFSREGSPARVFLEDCDYDPIAFQKKLETYHQRKEVYYLFVYPLDDLPLKVYDEAIQGIVKFRFSIGK